MTAENFPRCFSATLVHEGGWSDHPRDPGGATNKGIIQRTYDSWRKAQGKKLQSVRYISDDEVRAIYRDRYWRAVNGDKLPAGLDYVAYDAGVNSGPANGAKWLQRALGVSADGIVGGRTINAAAAAPDKPAVVRKACAIRMGFLQALKHWSTFGKGWTRRVAGVEALAVKMALEVAAAVTPVPVPKPIEQVVKEDADAEAKKAATSAQKNTAGATASGGAGGVTASQVDPAQVADPTNALMLGVVLIALVAGAYCLWRAYVQKTRAQVYSEIANT